MNVLDRLAPGMDEDLRIVGLTINWWHFVDCVRGIEGVAPGLRFLPDGALASAR